MLNKKSGVSLQNLYNIIDQYSPFKYSQMLIQQGSYDNSGILVKCNENVGKILFSLDLSEKTFIRAKRLGVDTIITHHPVIYHPLKSLSLEDDSKALLLAIKGGMNVISAHLNLDVASKGIDYYLACALGAKDQEILSPLEENVGYGRQFNVGEQSFKNYVNYVKKQLLTSKVISYGKPSETVNSVASFCGGGASNALELDEQNKVSADVIITSDMAHHVIKHFVEKDKKIILIPHYVSENLGFKKFFEHVKQSLEGKVDCEFFKDERFM